MAPRRNCSAKPGHGESSEGQATSSHFEFPRSSRYRDVKHIRISQFVGAMKAYEGYGNGKIRLVAPCWWGRLSSKAVSGTTMSALRMTFRGNCRPILYENLHLPVSAGQQSGNLCPAPKAAGQDKGIHPQLSFRTRRCLGPWSTNAEGALRRLRGGNQDGRGVLVVKKARQERPCPDTSG